MFASSFDQICVPLAGEPVVENASVEGLCYGVFADHTIVATAKSPILNRHENRTYQVRWITVYVKVGADWKIAASQATRLP